MVCSTLLLRDQDPKGNHMRLMNLEEAGEVLGITARQLRTVWLRNDLYDSRSFFRKMGRDWKVTERDFESFINQIPYEGDRG